MNERNDGGIKCSQIIEVLDDFADGSLEAKITLRIQEHLKTCENCANFGARYLAMLDALKKNIEVQFSN